MSTATLTKRTATVVLLQDEDEHRIQELRQDVDLAAAKADQGPRRFDDVTLRDAMAKHDDFLAEATERAVKIALRPLGRVAYRQLKEKHPPRKVDGTDRVNAADADWGFNVDTFGDDLVPPSVVDPDTFPPEWFNELTDGQWSKVVRTAVDLNEAPGADPTQRLGSSASRASGETSSSPARFA